MKELESGQHRDAMTIQVRESGFYQGFNPVVAVIPKLLIAALIIWVGLSPSSAG